MHREERLAVKRNLSNEMGSILQPFLHNKALSKVKYDRFLTEKKESLKDRGHKQRMENLSLEKDDLRFTRRMLENNNNKSLGTALHITQVLKCRPDAVKRMKNYIKGSVERSNGFKHLREPRAEHDFEWTPCRY